MTTTNTDDKKQDATPATEAVTTQLADTDFLIAELHRLMAQEVASKADAPEGLESDTSKQ